MICLNDINRKDAGFYSDYNQITIYTKSGKRIELPLLSKKETANKILDLIEIEIRK